MKRERRLFDVRELRAAKDGKRTISGHAAVFNKDSEPMYGFVERVAAGAFTKSIKEDDVRALFNHDPNLILGRNTAGTLRLSEDETGLAVEIDPPDTQTARDLLVSLERGDISQMSFGFYTRKDEWTYDQKTGTTTRTLLDCQLFDVSPVTFPAYPDTDVSVRSLEEIAEAGKRAIEAARAAAMPTQTPIEVRKKRIALIGT
jgi:HK97 family phage prohead protease